jgi:predicted small lipoprotein YifL
LLLLFLVVILVACGVKGPPRPPEMVKPAQPADGGWVDGGK